ncbi:ferredoxin [Actinoplanes subtropicus]|uniref:ferredoxin n=1 Tax=Actinoplanes subtropicus TaxID=543632 RepID=UPI0004C35640|nr:ferredoxin [Actinoplanes subtropicus]
MKIVADTTRCVGAGQCVLTEPDLFDQSPKDGTVIVLDDDPPPELHRAAREAALVCPSQALSVEE